MQGVEENKKKFKEIIDSLDDILVAHIQCDIAESVVANYECRMPWSWPPNSRPRDMIHTKRMWLDGHIGTKELKDAKEYVWKALDYLSGQSNKHTFALKAVLFVHHYVYTDKYAAARYAAISESCRCAEGFGWTLETDEEYGRVYDAGGAAQWAKNVEIAIKYQKE